MSDKIFKNTEHALKEGEDYVMSMKDRLVKLFTPHSNESHFNYFSIIKRVFLVVVIIYGIRKVDVIRKVVLAVLSALFTKWLTSKASQLALPGGKE
ncbi:MAG: hypothetical protein U0T73_12640 [Chitinophagales bacterium]